MLKDRNDSRWKRIIVFGHESIAEKVYQLDELGRLIEKFPKKQYRKNKKEGKKITASGSCPFLVNNTHQDDKGVVSKFIDAILRYNETDMSMMQLCYEQQQKQLEHAKNAKIQQEQSQLVKNAQTLQEQKQPDSIPDFDSDYIQTDIFDELVDSSYYSNEDPLEYDEDHLYLPSIF